MIEGNVTKLDTAFGPTENIHVRAGVRQGDIISPTLYMLFLNPLLKWIEEDNNGYMIGKDTYSIKAYADDMVLISGSKPGIIKKYE